MTVLFIFSNAVLLQVYILKEARNVSTISRLQCIQIQQKSSSFACNSAYYPYRLAKMQQNGN